MKNTRNYTINFAAKEIIVTKKFNKAAGVYGSAEYVIMTGLMKDFPEFTITVREIDKKENKVSYEGLTIYKMQAVVEFVADKESSELFQKQIKVYEGEKGKYATIKKLFLNSYKEAYQNLSVEEMADVDSLAKEIKAKALKEKAAAEKAANAEKVKAEAAARAAKKAPVVVEEEKAPVVTNMRKMSA